MEMVQNPEGKMTYPDHVKNRLFDLGYQAFRSWHGKVFFYLCMEEPKFWLNTFGTVYESNEEFEQDFYRIVWPKLDAQIEESSRKYLSHGS